MVLAAGGGEKKKKKKDAEGARDNGRAHKQKARVWSRHEERRGEKREGEDSSQRAYWVQGGWCRGELSCRVDQRGARHMRKSHA